jgi:RNA polymerase sigma-70 factor (ECF subfamily)
MAVSESSDHDLIGAVLHGDQAAYGVLVSRYQSLVFRSVYWICLDRDEAEDLTQEVFVRAYFALPTHDQTRPLAPWLLTIARNLSLTACRRLRREVPRQDAERLLGIEPDRRPSPASLAEDRELADRLWSAVDALPHEFREIVVLRHFSELTYEEICDVTGLPIGTVKSRLNRGRRLLAKSLAGERRPA